MSDRLKGKVAVITGSDSGIGQAIAIELAKEGADVTVTFLEDKDGAEKTRQQIEGWGRRAMVVQFDQRDPKQVAALFEEVECDGRVSVPNHSPASYRLKTCSTPANWPSAC